MESEGGGWAVLNTLSESMLLCSDTADQFGVDISQRFCLN